ncbi:MAG: hypothetical protein GVY26_00035 [Bacteroidetes bacterium]|jgi:hypothetical protein|nr:hypothetical protein [Bacteroidota bacterium]
MTEKVITLLLFVILMDSCLQQASDSKVYWVESNAICVHWTDFGKKNFDTKAIRIVLESKDSSILSSKDFYLSTNVLREKDIPLHKVEKIKEINGFYRAYLFVRSEDLYQYFPKGENYYNDDCYHIELANMVGKGQLLLQDNIEKKIIGKSSDYTLSVGPISNPGHKRK